jgi:hypothetical protein
MLRAGGTKRHKDLLAPFGLDASDPAFWKRGLDVISGFIDELEADAAWSDARRGRKAGRAHLFGEMRRMARTSGAVGGIAARVAGARVFGIKTDRAAHAEDLRAILGGLKGPLMKVAQFLSTVPDALPAEYAAELAELQANAPPWAGPSCAAAWQRTRPDWAAGFRRIWPEPRPRPAWARCTAPRCPMARMSRASCNTRHAQHGGSRSAPVEAGDGGLSPHG